jgi:hypothetical protein
VQREWRETEGTMQNMVFCKRLQVGHTLGRKQSTNVPNKDERGVHPPYWVMMQRSTLLVQGFPITGKGLRAKLSLRSLPSPPFSSTKEDPVRQDKEWWRVGNRLVHGFRTRLAKVCCRPTRLHSNGEYLNPKTLLLIRNVSVLASAKSTLLARASSRASRKAHVFTEGIMFTFVIRLLKYASE